MYAKVFAQILDSSIADDYQLRHFFTDMLVLADINGVVDMTPTAIAARTRIPVEKVTVFLAQLEAPDAESRSPESEGRRIVRLDKHRTWGWIIVNYDKFRKTASDEQRREKTADRVRKFKSRKRLTLGNAEVTLGNAGNAKQRKKQRKKQKQEEEGAFRAPTHGEVSEIFKAKNESQLEADKFFHHYSSNGWKVGKNRMQSLNSAIAGWLIRSKQYNPQPSASNRDVQLTELQLIAIAKGEIRDPRCE